MKMLIGPLHGHHFIIYRYYPKDVEILEEDFIDTIKKLNAKATTIRAIRRIYKEKDKWIELYCGFFLTYCPEYEDIALIKDKNLDRYTIIE